MRRVERTDSTGEFAPLRSRLKAADWAKKQNSFSFVVKNRAADPKRVQKQAALPHASPSEELAAFLGRVND
jgi:hypothetical protein